MARPLIVYGMPASQPSRSVFWVLLHRQTPFQLGEPMFSAADLPRFEPLNPRKQVPIIDDDGFVLHEMGAILAYLSTTRGWEDLYPSDPQRRAIVDQYLHFHHLYTRLATFKLMGPHVTMAFEGGPPEESTDVVMKETINGVIASGDKLAAGKPAVDDVLDLIERSFFRVDGKDSDFLCSDGAPTIADFACYEDVGQLRWAGLHDFRPCEKLSPWLERMSRLPAHDVVHAYNFALGDIVTEPNTLERFLAASLAGLSALRDAGVTFQFSLPTA
ncbi:MAG: glutathione S-transferase family protein [Proteobacteria bacterium]|nr:glutathione S-transferase family protein [Pseudomonadota bacterium]